MIEAAFFDFPQIYAHQKHHVIEMINSHYDQFTGDDDSSLFKRL